MTKTLRSRVIRLAHAHPEFRHHLLPLLKRGSAWYDRWSKSLGGMGSDIAFALGDDELVQEGAPNLRQIVQVLTSLEKQVPERVGVELKGFLTKPPRISDVDVMGADGEQTLEGTVLEERSRSRWDPADVEEIEEPVEVTYPEEMSGKVTFYLDMEWVVDLYFRALHPLVPDIDRKWLAGQFIDMARKGGSLYDLVEEQVGDVGDEITLGAASDVLAEAARDAMNVSYYGNADPSVSISCSGEGLVTSVDIDARGLEYSLDTIFTVSVFAEID